jgi:hypothetical protein
VLIPAGRLEFKLPTIWTDENAEVERVREEKRRRKIREEKKIKDRIIELDDGKIYRKALYLMVKTMVSCRFSRKPIQ